jgi:uncharacterized protein YycO
MHRPFAHVKGASSERYGPGEEASQPQPGDFILTHSNDWVDKLIRLGQWFRFSGQDRKYAYWTHAAIIVDHDGGLIEALPGGVCKSHLSKYQSEEYHLVRLGTSAHPTDRAEAVQFAEWCLNHHQQYSWFTLLGMLVGLATGGKISFGYEGQTICSGLVARALERTTAIFNRNTEDIMPADLAKYYGVEPPVFEMTYRAARRIAA